MPVRIYALAKELSLDSKELVDHCRKAGISGKGSALASLNDDEVERVKQYLSGPKKSASGSEAKGGSKPSAEDTVYTRDDYIAAPRTMAGKVKVIDVGSRKPAKKPAKPAKPVEPAEPPAAEPTRVADTPEPPADAPQPVSRPADSDQPPMVKPPAPQRPNDISANREISARSGDSGQSKSSGRSTPKKRGPVIRLAEMPDAKPPPIKVKSKEPQAQKPDIRLPKDAIAGHKAGSRPPLEHLTKSGGKQKGKDAGDRPGGRKVGNDMADVGVAAPLSGKGKRRRGGGGESEGKEGRGLAGMASARADRQKARKDRTKSRSGKIVADDDISRARSGQPTRSRRPRTLTRRRGVNTAAPRKEKAVLTLPCTVRSFSEAAGVPSAQVLRSLMNTGMMLNINAQLDDEAVYLLADELGVDIEFKQQESLEDSLIQRLDEEEDAPEDLTTRPPIITFLGHVDHGKTSLLDYLIGINVVSGEAGGITQHIRAYEISKDGRKIAFVDTPGHEAFTEMRARGANVTDIAVLVVAADDGVMPQTEEAISHAKAAGVPIIVALNKIDLPGVDANKALQDLATLDLLPSEWGGDIEVVRTSAITGEGMDELLETILVTAELHEYQANPKRPATGVCLEAEQEAERGVITKLIVQNGTIAVGDVVVCGAAHGKVKAMYDTLRPKKRVKKAGPSTPVNVTGFDKAPDAGDRFYVLDSISDARQIAESRADRSRERSLSGGTTKVSLEEFQRRLSEGNLVDQREVVTLNLIVRADVRGSIEAIQKELSKLEHPDVQVKLLQASVGGITAADVMLAHASEAVIVGFNVIPDEAARTLADEKQVEIRRYDVIYKVSDDVKATLEGKLKPEQRVVELGHALVKRVFSISRVGAVAGCYIIRGSIKRGCRIRVNRDGRTIGTYDLDSLRREKDDVKEVPRGMECGIKLSGFNDIKQDDILEAFEIEEIARTL